MDTLLHCLYPRFQNSSEPVTPGTFSIFGSHVLGASHIAKCSKCEQKTNGEYLLTWIMPDKTDKQSEQYKALELEIQEKQQEAIDKLKIHANTDKTFHWTDDDKEIVQGTLIYARTIRGKDFYLFKTENEFQVVSREESEDEANYRSEEGELYAFYEYWKNSPWDGMNSFKKEKDAWLTLDDIEFRPDWFSPCGKGKENEL